MAGFVYIMSNPSFADERIKIGKSDRDPEEFRKSELNSTGVPEPFKVEYSAYVQNHHELEIKIHRHFKAQRPNKNREFFTCSIMDAISAIQSIAGEALKHEENFYAEYKKLKREREEREAAKKQREEKRRQEKRRKERQREKMKSEAIKIIEGAEKFKNPIKQTGKERKVANKQREEKKREEREIFEAAKKRRDAKWKPKLY